MSSPAKLPIEGPGFAWGRDDMSVRQRLDRLSDGQIDCLILVDRHLSSKEIAVRLAISPHTVDQRIRHALQQLGVGRRGEAARLVAEATAHCERIAARYQRLIHQAPYLPETEPAPQFEAAVSSQIRHADRAEGTGTPGLQTEQGPAAWSPLPLPIATRRHPRNEMRVGMRLFWILAIAMGSTFSVGMYLAGLESLVRLLSR